MTPTRFLVGQILVVFAIVIGRLWLSTEWVAAALGHQPRPGFPIRCPVLRFPSLEVKNSRKSLF
jgi:hypothetical protein